MAKNCLNKLVSNITVGCTINPVGVKNIYLMHVGDVTFTVSPNVDSVSLITFAEGARSYKIEGYKQNIQVTSSLMATDASAKLGFSVAFKIPFAYPFENIATVNKMLVGKFYVLVEYVNGLFGFIGYTSPLECSAADFDSNANSCFVSVTLSAPEGSAGNYFMDIAIAARNLIISKSV